MHLGLYISLLKLLSEFCAYFTDICIHLYLGYSNIPEHICTVLKLHLKDKEKDVLFLLVPCCTGVRVRKCIVEPLFLFFLSIVFYRPPPLSIFHPPPIFSYPSSHSPPISAVAFPFSTSALFASLPASILTKWPAHLILFLTNLPVRLYCIPTSFLRSFILLLSILFVLVIQRTQLFSQTCSFCCCSVKPTVSIPCRRVGVTHALRTFPFSFFKICLSNMTPLPFSKHSLLLVSYLCPTSHFYL